MIKLELYDTKFKRHYSDSGLKIRKVGTAEVYDDAVDLLSSTFEYEETDEQIMIKIVEV